MEQLPSIERGVSDLIHAIMEQAIMDYRLLAKHGYVKKFQATNKPSNPNVSWSLKLPKDAQETCSFFNSKRCDEVLELCAVKFDTQTVKNRLLKEESYEA